MDIAIRAFAFEYVFGIINILPMDTVQPNFVAILCSAIQLSPLSK